MFEGFAGFMETAQIFFNWWYFTAGIALGVTAGIGIAFIGVPTAYKVKRRKELRKQWQQDEPREISAQLLPHWGEYDPEAEEVDSRCVCHWRRIVPGERVLLWPEVGGFGLVHTSVYCENVRERV
jgi:hypothetical protein